MCECVIRVNEYKHNKKTTYSYKNKMRFSFVGNLRLITFYELYVRIPTSRVKGITCEHCSFQRANSYNKNRYDQL